MKLPKTWPKVVERGHSLVKIYRTPSNGRDQFTIVYYLGEKRIRKTFAKYGLAFTEAETVATKLSEGEVNVLELKGVDQFAYVRAVETLRPTGVPIEMAATIFAEVYRIVGDKAVEAAHFHAKFHPRNLPKRTVAEVVGELIEEKEGDQISDVYIDHLRSRLGRFADEFKGQISLVTTGDIERFLRELKVSEKLPSGEKRLRPASPKSRNHYRGSIGTLFYFAEARGYVAKGLVDIEAVAVAKQKGGEIEIFRPEELGRVLAAAEPALIPFLTLGAFAGLRHAEIQRLDWSEVHLDDSFIEVKAGKAKTASRRLIPITDNLRTWLVPHRKPQGPVCPYANMSKQLLWLAEAVHEAWQAEPAPGRFEWKHNGLRHSFISYRVADIQNVAQVALEAGNSPRMVFSNYRELVRPADAKKWFAITPESVEEIKAKAERERAAKIVPMPQQAAA